MKINRHCNTLPDWCHLCGTRQLRLTDVWFAENAEHGGPETEYVRICVECAEAIRRVASGLTPEP